MGLFGALTTAVTGMRAQSFALENISGNIANSQTTAFKRMDTSFVDLIPDQPPSKQQAGDVTANARSTNTVQGSVQSSSIGTFMAINGDGFFVTQKPSSIVDNRPVFSGINLFTRRGDFQPDKNGFLVNGAGYFLMGIPVDSTTGNLVGSVPQVLKFQNDFLPAQATTTVDYRANLASYPLTSGHDVNIAKSELIDPANFIANPLAGPPAAAKITGTGATLLPDAAALVKGTSIVPNTLVNNGTVTINGTVVNFTAGMNHAAVLAAINTSVQTVTGTGGFTVGGTVGGAPAAITIQAAGLNGGGALSIATIVAGDTAATAATKINAALAAAPGGNDGITVDGSSGQLVLKSVTGDVVTLAGNSATLTSLSFAPGNRVSAGTAAPPGVQAATIDSAGHLVLTSTDADSAITLSAGTGSVLGELGMAIGITNPTNLLTQSAVAPGDTLTITIGANPPVTITFGTNDAAGQISTLAELNVHAGTGLDGVNGGIASVNASNGNISIDATSPTDSITISGTAVPKTFGMHTTSAIPSNQIVVANDVNTFLKASIGGGAVTAYDISGSPANIQLRWAKTAAAVYGGTDTWNLFYQVNSHATGNQPAWQNAGVDYTFGPNGQMLPVVSNVTLSNVTVDGLNLGTVQLVHGAGGITQFADPNGNAQVNLLQQNGFPAGELQSVNVNSKGRIVGSYSNGRTIDLAEITLANFNGPNNLKRLDGGAFEVTDESGPAIFGASGKIAGSSLEGSNTDIGDEFTKLIVTQQAYSANTKVITTTNLMVQDLLNMLR